MWGRLTAAGFLCRFVCSAGGIEVGESPARGRFFSGLLLNTACTPKEGHGSCRVFDCRSLFRLSNVSSLMCISAPPGFRWGRSLFQSDPKDSRRVFR